MAEPSIAAVYPEVHFGGFSSVDGTIEFYSRVNALLTPDSLVLDVGCGRGAGVEDPVAYRRDLRCLRGKVARVLGIDVEPEGAENPTIDEFRLMRSPERWPVDDVSVDLVLGDFVLEHVEQPDRFFAEASRVLRPGGSICLRTTNALGYVAFGARLSPRALQARIVEWAQPGRRAHDVFPVRYRCNTRRQIRSSLTRVGFDVQAIYGRSGEPSYFRFSGRLYGMVAKVHHWLPESFQTSIFVFARRSCRSPAP